MIFVDSSEILNIFIKLWTIGGVMSTKKYKFIFPIYSLFVNFNLIVLFPLTLMLDVFQQDNMGGVIEGLSTALAVVGFSFKQTTIFSSKSNLQRINNILQELDQRIQNKDEIQIIEASAKLCKRLFLAWTGFNYMTFLAVAIGGLFTKHHLIFPAWFPFDLDAEYNAWMASAYQIITTAFIVLQTVLLDVFPVISLTILAAHIEVLGLRIRGIGKTVGEPDDNYNLLVAGVQTHREIKQLLGEISEVTKRLLTVQFCLTTFCLCTKAIIIVQIQRSFFEKVADLLFMGALLLQIFPSCYCMNRVINVNRHLTLSAYESNWITQDLTFKKAMIIFMQNTQRDVVLLVHFIPVNLSTFLDLLKFSFSMYTLLSELNK